MRPFLLFLVRAILSVILAVALPGLASAQNGRSTLIRNVSIVTLDERGTLANGALLVRDGRITRIIDSGSALPAGDTVIDGGSGFLMPGLIDAHIHNGTPRSLTSFLRYGVTTAFALAARPNELAGLPELRRRIDAGEIAAPHFFATGASIGGYLNLTSPEQVAPYLDTLQSLGLEYIKVYNNIPQAVFDRVVAEARRRGMAVFGHVPRSFPPAYSVSHGLNVIAHMEELFFTEFQGPRDSALPRFSPGWRPDLTRVDPILDQIAQNNVAIITNLIASHTFTDLWVDEDQVLAGPESAYLTAEQQAEWRQYNYSHRDRIELRMLREQIKQPLLHLLTLRASEKGILLLAGSDVGIPGIYPGLSLHQELRLLVAAGLTKEQALRTATINGGSAASRFVADSICIGVIKVGCEADLVLLRASPLADIRNTQAIVGVMTDGRWYLREELDRLAKP